MSRLLVIGLSGQVGRALQALLPAQGEEVLALSRWPQAALPELRWLHGSLEAMPEPCLEADTIFSLGPLDAFVRWYAPSRARARRVVALGSMGREDKRHSADPAEQELAQRLAEAEAQLFAAAARRGVAVTVLRPSLVYGGAGDRALAPLLAHARRWRFLPMPAGATGRRQPVHADDVAAAVLACRHAPASFGRGYDLPGGEVLAFDAMLQRALVARAPCARLLRLPDPLFRLALGMARHLLPGLPGNGVLSRLDRDQTGDPGPAQRDFGYAPGPFRP